MPDYMDEFVQAQWDKQNGAPAPLWNRQAQLERIQSENQEMPDKSWIGWSPDMPLKGIKTKLVKQYNYNYHDFDLWAEDENIADYTPTATLNPLDFNVGVINRSRHRAYQMASKLGVTDIKVAVGGTSQQGGFNGDIEIDVTPYIANHITNNGN